MSRVLPPSPTRAEQRLRAEVTSSPAAREARVPRDLAPLAPREDALSLDPLRATDRYRFALVYDECGGVPTSAGAPAPIHSILAV
jgi:hypothetical protein